LDLDIHACCREGGCKNHNQPDHAQTDDLTCTWYYNIKTHKMITITGKTDARRFRTNGISSGQSTCNRHNKVEKIMPKRPWHIRYKVARTSTNMVGHDKTVPRCRYQVWTGHDSRMSETETTAWKFGPHSTVNHEQIASLSFEISPRNDSTTLHHKTLDCAMFS